MWEVADILRRYGEGYLQAFGEAMLPSHRRAIQDILSCRTPARGGHVFSCDRCGHRVYAYHSCRNRSCPKCHARDTESWLEARRTELLPVPYFHVVFTIPTEWRRLVRRHQKPLYGILMKAAAQALIKLAADPHYVGGSIGVMAILHTWTRTLAYHPHVHCLVPAGGVSPDRRWLSAREDYLVPVRALSKIFRGLFTDLVAKQMPNLELPASAGGSNWVVYCKRSVQGVDTVLNYLARYVHRVAITNSRILSIDEGKVTFRYQNSGDSTWKTMTLAASEFIRRFLQHVLPMGAHKVRYYGLWAPSNRGLLRQVQLLLTADQANRPSRESDHRTKNAQRVEPQGETCPRCGIGVLACIGRIPRNRRAPP
jgi:hypothetical protein